MLARLPVPEPCPTPGRHQAPAWSAPVRHAFAVGASPCCKRSHSSEAPTRQGRSFHSSGRPEGPPGPELGGYRGARGLQGHHDPVGAVSAAEVIG